MLMEPVLEYDHSETFYPDAVDLETVERPYGRYTLGRLPNGEVVVKSITHFGGCYTSAKALGIVLRRLRNQHKPLCGCDD